jgi:hypothetical protein
VSAKHVEDVIIEPGRMAEFDGVTILPGQGGQKAVEPFRVFVESGRQLPKNRSEMLSQRRDAFEVDSDGFSGHVQFFHLRDETASLSREDKAVRRAIMPATDHFFAGQTVECRVQFDGGELGMIKVEVFTRWESFRIKRAAGPRFVRPTTRAYPQLPHVLRYYDRKCAGIRCVR